MLYELLKKIDTALLSNSKTGGHRIISIYLLAKHNSNVLSVLYNLIHKQPKVGMGLIYEAIKQGHHG